MRRVLVIVVGVVLLAFFIGIVATTLGSSAQEVTPTELIEGDFEGETVEVQGRIGSIDETRDVVAFSIRDYNHSVWVSYDGSVPSTFEEDRFVIARGVITDGELDASTVKIQAHLETDDPER